MPDKRKHRGKHPADERLFAAAQHAALRTAVAEYSWLLTRGYAESSALKLVGDRHALTERQRTAVWRSACSDDSQVHRRRSETTSARIAGRALGIDGYNVLITLESALSGGLILIGRDGCHRDLASVHSTYRKVEETIPALGLIFDHLATLAPARIDWYLDRPVSNSGRLKALIAERLGQRLQTGAVFNIELLANPDQALIAYDGTCASTDSVVLDGCRYWINLAAAIIATRVPQAWIVDLCPAAGEGPRGS